MELFNLNRAVAEITFAKRDLKAALLFEKEDSDIMIRSALGTLNDAIQVIELNNRLDSKVISFLVAVRSWYKRTRKFYYEKVKGLTNESKD